MSGQKNCPDKNCPDKKIVRTKILSGQKNCPDKKIVGTKKNCGGQKIVWTKKLSWIFFCPGCQCPLFCLYIFCPSSPWFVVLSNFCPYSCPYFCPIVQQKHWTNFRNIFQLFRNNHKLSKKNLKRDCVLVAIQHRLTQWPNELSNNKGICRTVTAITGQLNYKPWQIKPRNLNLHIFHE